MENANVVLRQLHHYAPGVYGATEYLPFMIPLKAMT